MRAALIRLARFAGFGLAIACAGFVAWRWYASHSSTSHGGTLDPARITAAAALYALCGLPLAAGWLASLRLSGERRIPAPAALLGYLTTQIGKYIPGGIFHFVFRHAHGRDYGAGHAQLAAAGIIETLSLLTAASLVMLAFGDTLSANGLGWIAHVRYLPLAATAIAAGLWVASRRAARSVPAPAPRPAWLMTLLVLHLGFFALSALACSVLPATTLDFATVLPAVSAAWLAGYVVVGAPGGLGVREAVLVLLLKSSLGEASAIGVAVSFRLATVAGDAIMAAVAAAIRGRRAQPTLP